MLKIVCDESDGCFERGRVLVDKKMLRMLWEKWEDKI